MDSARCIVVFPVYKPLTEREFSFFKQALRMTVGFNHVFAAPQSLSIDSPFEDLCKIVRFPDCYFESITGYNHLMLSAGFYQAFEAYEYVLIHQLDAYLFRPELEYWCNKGYDYIGAPWLKPKKRKKSPMYKFILSYFPNFYSVHKRKLVELYNNVGNGGLSLRKVETFLKILNQPETENILLAYKERMIGDTLYNEDIFWSVEASRIDGDFRKPGWQEALSFAVETYPSFAYRHTGGELPFGCHAPDKYEPEFWDKYITVDK